MGKVIGVVAVAAAMAEAKNWHFHLPAICVEHYTAHVLCSL